ncbi:MAG: N-acyl homoserine lactonase family protein [Actinomycetota bacterium]|nr:N-acyl homoserine lactonase family protein [Actinomycetota bacterium]
MKIHPIQTGTVAIKTRQVHGTGHGVRRQLNMLVDREWTEPLPIYAFAIEHPEGVIVVDTGETARTSEPGYLPRWHPFYRYGVRQWVAPEQEIGPQLQNLGIRPNDVRWVVMTHMHTDHAGGLHHFPDTEILVSRGDQMISSGLRGRLRGYLNNRLPSWFDPTIVDLRTEAFGPFPQSLRLTQAGDVTIVPLHGHTPGQIGVVVEDGDHSVMIAGDSSYTEQLMLRGIIDGVSPQEDIAKLTHQRIRAFAAQTPTVYLVAHDPDVPARLAERRFTEITPKDAAAAGSR